ncbi:MULTISPECIES: FeoC-like transcriptional regulator [Gammaproteobacteria]|uniref:FeoC-like transcriptional regulator n=1 Tax=Gammaproteobacteria TaxID=1236 RepID=UPI000C78D4D6|nr:MULTISPECIES: FeoC-like transcriptional regulator [Gammaproteobacteria]MBO9481476.1 FeoC-like transcriptional regulator [Salinisphaera sp. G21_0]WBA83935.1 FeoC-like transcriptional regulator [Endozoicomonas sp. GU-1]WBA86916.1 FeoC-like transcriptional regulator [Endozoicomonas sp. GU-1]
MLIKIRDYLKQQKVCSLADLSVKFNTTPEAMRGMLSHWLRKGQLSCEQPGCFVACKKGCVSCDPAELEIYRWQGKSQHIPLSLIG